MSILWAIIIGFIVGIVAKFLMPGRDPGGFIVTTLLGIVGALVATFLGRPWESTRQASASSRRGRSNSFAFLYNLVRRKRPLVCRPLVL